jgi:hypothetical protein
MRSSGRKPRLWLWLCWLACVLLCPVGTYAQVTVQIGQNVTATTYGNTSSALPPDPDGAIGPSQFVEFINGDFAVFNLTNINNPAHMSDIDFWTSTGINVPSDDAVTDPRIIYDSASGRWFASMVDANANASDPTVFANNFLFAVSATSNALGTWTGFRFLADPDNGYFADFPTLGVDSNAVYISGDMFQSSVELAASLVSIPKADLLGATPTIANRTFHGDLDYGIHGMVLQAATCFDGTSTGNILSVENLGTDSSFYSNIVNFTVLNGNTPSASLSTPTNLTGPPYMVPDNADMGAPLLTPTQPDGTTMLQANDARFCGRVYCVGGVIYAVHNTEVNGRIAILWYRVSAASHKLLESGVITNSDLDLFFPAIAANTSGTVMVTCNGCSIDTFVSCFAIAGQTVGGVTTFGSPIVLQSGVVSYHGDDETLIDPFEGLPPFSRWGDYSTISVDPKNANNFWIVEMYPSDSANNDVWSTQVIQLLTTPAAALSIARAGTNVMIAWPDTASGYQLQAKTDLAPAVTWTNMPQTVSSNTSQFFVLAPIAKGNQYFRLFHP